MRCRSREHLSGFEVLFVVSSQLNTAQGKAGECVCVFSAALSHLAKGERGEGCRRGEKNERLEGDTFKHFQEKAETNKSKTRTHAVLPPKPQHTPHTTPHTHLHHILHAKKKLTHTNTLNTLYSVSSVFSNSLELLD